MVAVPEKQEITFLVIDSTKHSLCIISILNLKKSKVKRCHPEYNQKQNTVN